MPSIVSVGKVRKRGFWSDFLVPWHCFLILVLFFGPLILGVAFFRFLILVLFFSPLILGVAFFRFLILVLFLGPLSEHILGVAWFCYSVPCPQTQVYTITMAVMVYTITMADGAAKVRFSGPLQTLYNCSGGWGFQAQFNNICFYLGFLARHKHGRQYGRVE